MDRAVDFRQVDVVVAVGAYECGVVLGYYLSCGFGPATAVPHSGPKATVAELIGGRDPDNGYIGHKLGLASLFIWLEFVGEDHGVVVHQLFVVGWAGEGAEVELTNQGEVVLVSAIQPVLVLEGALEHDPDTG